MRRDGLFILLLLLTFASRSFAEALTAKEAVCRWSKEGASWTIEQTLRIYDARDARGLAFAQAAAEQGTYQSQLQKLVRDKWGPEAETLVARAMGTDTLEDDQAATENVDGAYATLAFKETTGIPLVHLLKVNGEWRIDVQALLGRLGPNADRVRQFVQRTVPVLQAALRDLKADKFKNADDVALYLKAEFEKVASSK